MKPDGTYPALARRTLEHYFASGEAPAEGGVLLPAGTEQAVRDSLASRARGVFVSLKIGGELRGCIGTIAGTRATLGEEIAANALAAAFSDPRFPPLQSEELAKCSISVDVLGEAEDASREELDAQKYGVIVTSGRRRGLLLPALEGVDDVETQLAIALRKGGIRPDEPYQIQRFEVRRYKERA